MVTACKKYAFEKSDYPVIFSIENHCSVEQQDVMADHLIDILGDLLYVHNINDEEEHVMPSPMHLRKKVLIKAKRRASNDEEADSDNHDDVDEAKKKLSKKLSDLVNYIHAVHFPGFEESNAKFYHMSSFGESKTIGILEDPEKNVKFVNYNMKQMSR